MNAILSERRAARPIIDSVRLDWLLSVLSLWMIGGIHLDAWAHHRFELETFFTPWHGVLYSGFLATSGVLVLIVLVNRTRAPGLRAAIPTGYGLSLAGSALFMVGGLSDMIWHTLLGIERSIEALVSPPHLLLVVGGGLIVTGPLRAAWARAGDRPILAQIAPALVSSALLLALFVFFTSYANPLAEASHLQERVFGDLAESRMATSMAGILLQSAMLAGLLMLLGRRWKLPVGSWTLILTVQVALSVSSHEDWRFVPIGLLTGLAMDIVLSGTQDVPRWFAAATPSLFIALFFATLALSGGLWWPVSMLTGAIVLAGLTGWLVSYIARH